jgi:hypothetical protein
VSTDISHGEHITERLLSDLNPGRDIHLASGKTSRHQPSNAISQIEKLSLSTSCLLAA